MTYLNFALNNEFVCLIMVCFHSASQPEEAEVKSSYEKFVTRFSRVYGACAEAPSRDPANLHRPPQQPLLIVPHSV